MNTLRADRFGKCKDDCRYNEDHDYASSARITLPRKHPILDELSAGKAVVWAMNQFALFVARVQAIARTNQNEAAQKVEVEKLLEHFVLMSREAHSGERLEAERVHNDVRGLHDYLVSEVNQHYADRLGVLMEHAYALAVQRIGSHGEGRDIRRHRTAPRLK